MNNFNPDTYCGIYCGACSIAMHGETGRADGFVACLGSVPKEDLVCGGCKSDTVYAGCSTCSLRRCAREKGIAHCVDCTDYPCKIYSKWQSVAKYLPHSREAVSKAQLFHGMHRSATSVAARSRQKRTRYPAGGNSCAVSCSRWCTGKERRKIKGTVLFNLQRHYSGEDFVKI